MRDESLIHFHYNRKISAGIHLSRSGFESLRLIESATPFFDREAPGRCVAGFCAVHAHLVEDILPPPPPQWPQWRFADWDAWFGRINGVFLVDLQALRITHYPMYRSAPATPRIDFSKLPGRLKEVRNENYGEDHI